MSEPKLVASSKARGRAWRKRVPTTLVALGCVAAVGAALTAAVSPVPALDFLPSGHWVFNTITGLAVHIDGGSPSVDASVEVDGAGPGSQVVQGPDTGYVISEGQITVFGKSSLSVEQQIDPQTTEPPVAVEAVGGPYLFYGQSGKIVRLGDAPASIATNGSFADQVITPDGTIWLYKKDTGNICPLARNAERIGSCPVTLPRGHDGSLTVVGNQPKFLDTTSDVLSPLSDKGLGAGQGVGFQVSPDARLASSDVDGRVAILDPGTHEMHLIDATEPARDPAMVDLGTGDFTTPSSTGSVVAVVDRKGGVVRTYDSHGTPHGERAIKNNDGKPRVSKGEDNRVYVENGDGTDVVVVGQNGELSDVPAVITTQGAPNAPKAKPDRKPVPGGPKLPERDERTAPPNDTPPQTHDNPAPPKRTAPPQTHEPPVIPATRPGAPAGVSATAGNASATVNWGAANSNRASITSYRITWSGGTKTVSGGIRSAKVTGLTNGTRYTFDVVAVNSAGRGPAASASATPIAAAAAPTQLDLAVDPATGDGKLTWKQPDLGGGTLLNYKVTATGFQVQSPSGASAPFPGVVPGQTYTFTVRAVTKTAGGQTLTGAAATFSFTVPGPTPKLTVTRGVEDCPGYPDEPNCAQMHVQLTGFQPNTRYDITPHSDDPYYGNPGSGQTTDDNGAVSFDAFEYFGTGHMVWVTVKTSSGTVSSTKIRWE